jgi:hypothetical protein
VQRLLGLASAAVAGWVVVTAAIEHFEPGALDTEYTRNTFIRGELELLVVIAATLAGAFVLRGSRAAVLLLGSERARS